MDTKANKVNMKYIGYLYSRVMNIQKHIENVSIMQTKAMIDDNAIVSFLPRIFLTNITIIVSRVAIIVQIGPRVGNSVLLMHYFPALFSKNPGLVHFSTHSPSYKRYGRSHSKQLAPSFVPHSMQFSAHFTHFYVSRDIAVLIGHSTQHLPFHWYHMFRVPSQAKQWVAASWHAVHGDSHLPHFLSYSLSLSQKYPITQTLTQVPLG